MKRHGDLELLDRETLCCWIMSKHNAQFTAGLSRAELEQPWQL